MMKIQANVGKKTDAKKAIETILTLESRCKLVEEQILKWDYDENLLLSFRIFSRSIKSICSKKYNAFKFGTTEAR